MINQICSGAAKHGVQSEVLTVSDDTSSIDFGDHIHHRAKLNVEIASSAFSWAALRRFSELAQNADVIHYHFPWPFADVVHFATRLGKPSLVTYHSDIVRQKFLLQFYKPLRNRFLASVDSIVATSPNYLASSEVLQRYKSKVEIIPIGLNPDSYSPPTAARLEYWRKRIGPKFFLFVGNLRYYKGLHILLDALRDAAYPTVVVGAGPVEKALHEQASRLRLDHVHFVGPVDDEDKVALLQLCHAVTFPSHLRSEAFGISLLEGAMFGKPLISAEIGTGTSYVNINEETGLIVSPNDPASLKTALDRIWSDDQLASRLGANARMRFEAEFTASKMAVRYVSLYRRLSESRAGYRPHQRSASDA